MTELIISVISLLVLFPIIYFLPLGLTRKGKGILMIIAFVIANIGLFAKSSFDLWQIGLIILLLAFFTVFLLDKRFAKLLYSNSSTYETAPSELYEDGDLDIQTDDLQEKEDTFINSQIQLEKDTKESETEEENIELEKLTLDSEELEMDEAELKGEDFELEELSFEKEETEESPLYEEVSVFSGDENLEIDDETALLLERKEIIEDRPIETTDEDEIQDAGYLSEIEQLLENGDNDFNQQSKEIELSSNQSEVERVEKSVLDLLDDSELDLIDIEPLNEDIEELPKSDESYNETSDYAKLLDDPELDLLNIDLLEENKDNLPEEPEVDESTVNGSDTELHKEENNFEDLLEEDLDFGENLGGIDSHIIEVEQQPVVIYDEVAATVTEKEQEEILSPEQDFNFEDFLEDVELEDFIDDEDEDTLHQAGDTEQKSALQQQLFHTMVSQLHLAKKQLSAGEYEALVKEHLHPDLPLQDYYTFASLLIEHYISQKEIGKLEELLTNLEGKFTDFPILDMEIQYLSQQYCKKAR